MACSPLFARTVPAHIWTVGSSESEPSASSVAAERSFLARATRDLDAASRDFERVLVISRP